MAKRVTEIHLSIRKALGYGEEESVIDILSDWKRRTTTVCKPCWELKYCPYGPLVEQLPLLPSPLSEYESHNSYLRGCLSSNQLGSLAPLDDESRERFQAILSDQEFARSVAVSQVTNEMFFEDASDSDNPLDKLAGPLPPLEQYRVPFEFRIGADPTRTYSPEIEARIKSRIIDLQSEAETSIKAGMQDSRKPLDKARRALFEKQLSEFNPENYPPSVPEIFTEAACNIFGHICPVFFAAESITETSEARRRGRYISFATKIRVVRRDNHTCQECGIHLRDDEVEFDHRIPVSKGGSSEEHNIRLTCYDCNRDKSNRVDI